MSTLLNVYFVKCQLYFSKIQISSHLNYFPTDKYFTTKITANSLLFNSKFSEKLVKNRHFTKSTFHKVDILRATLFLILKYLGTFLIPDNGCLAETSNKNYL